MSRYRCPQRDEKGLPMIETVQLFDDDTTRMLRSFIGWTIESAQGYLLATDPDQAHKRIRLDLGGITIDVVNEHDSLCIGPGRVCEDVAVMRAEEDSPASIWHPRGKELTRREFQLTIDDIYTVVDTVILSKGSIRKNKLKQVQALVFRGGDELLIIDRDIWFDENLVIKWVTIPSEGGYIFEDQIYEAIEDAVRPCAGDWAAEPPLSYEFDRQISSINSARR